MKAPADGWDGEEREAVDAIDALRDELETRRTRRLDAHQLALLRAARHEVLPDEVQRAADDHLMHDAWSRALVDGLDDAEPAFDQQSEDRILDRVRRDGQSLGVAGAGAIGARSEALHAAQEPKLGPGQHREARRGAWLRPALATAAMAALAIAGWIALRSLTPTGDQRDVPPQPPPAAQTGGAAVAAAPPAWRITLDKPDITLSLASLTWRRGSDGGNGGSRGDNRSDRDNQLLVDLKQPLDAFRSDDYTSADRDFAALESRYPNAVEVFFYGGVSRLFVNEPQRAITALTRSAALSDTTFAPRTAWYLAIAEERAGRLPDARARLAELCRGSSERAPSACAAVTRIDALATPHAR